MSGISLDQAAKVKECEVTVASVLPLVVESKESAEITKAEVKSESVEKELSIDSILNLMTEEKKDE